MKLKTIISDDSVPSSTLDLEKKVSSLSSDSREVKEGTLFFAIVGAKFDSHKLIPEVLKKGAIAIVSEDEHSCKNYTSSFIIVPSIREAIADFAARFYNNPTSNIPTIGITGTNGKTSVAWIVRSLLRLLEQPASYVGTLGFGSVMQDEISSASNTTPEPIALYSFLEKEKQLGAKAFVLEVTSQGLVQKRTKNVSWDVAVFTNLSRDHLDLHETFERYSEAKKEFFRTELLNSSKEKKSFVVNIDDACGREIYEEFKNKFSAITYSTKERFADFYLEAAELTTSGTLMTLLVSRARYQFKTKLVGRYNLSNVLASLATLYALGFDLGELEDKIALVPSVPGRLELIGHSAYSVFVDYAHTPDALDAVQESLLELKPKRLITVFGCGGDRDRGKRVLMGASVAKFSDYAIVTSDNPRTENPDKIIQEILPAFENAEIKREIIPDRQKAIYRAIQIAEPGDAILIAGKGHEDYQEINGEKFHFSDKEVCLTALNKI